MERNCYQKLLKWKDSGTKPLVLLGARQVGKTYLLKHFAQINYSSFHYFNFEQTKKLHDYFEEDFYPDKIIENLQFYIEKTISADHLIIFDEIQECPMALKSLKYFCEDGRFKVVAAGSLLGLQLSSESFPVGKVDLQYLHPLSFKEFLQASNQFLYRQYVETSVDQVPLALHDKLKDEYLKYLFVGGMPEAVKYFLQAQDEQGIEKYLGVRKIQQDILQGYYADFAKHSGKVNSMHINKTWQQCAIQIGKQKDESVKRFYFKDVLHGKKQYSQFQSIFNWLDKAGLIHMCHLVESPQIPLKAYSKESFFKAYIFDVGILGAMIDIPFSQILEERPDTYKGFLAENFIAIHLRIIGRDNLYYWTGKQSEVEFLLQQQYEVIPIEVKSGSRTKSKSLLSFRNKYSPSQMHVYSMQAYSENNGLLKIPLWAIEKFF